jgi:putative membrane protein
MKSSNPPSIRRQHPISILFFIASSVKNLLYPMLAFLVSAIVRDDIQPIWVYGGAAVFLVLIMTMGIVSWLRYTYRFEGGYLHVEHGIIVHKKLSIPRSRVQSIDMSAGLVHRMFGVLKLQIETAGGSKPEVTLSAIGKQEAALLQAELHRIHSDAADLQAGDSIQERGPVDDQDEHSVEQIQPPTSAPVLAAQYPTHKVPLRSILLYSATSGRVFLALAALSAVYSQVDDWIESSELWDNLFASADLGVGQIIGVVVAGAFIAWLIGVMLTTAKEYGFTLMLQDGKLVTVRGLIERKQATVSLKRIQAVYMKQNALRRLLGLVSVHIVTAGSVDKLNQSHLLCPIISRAEADALLARFMPGYYVPEQVDRLTRRSIGGFLTMPISISVLIAVPGILWIPYDLGWLMLIIPIYVAAWSWLRFKHTGWKIDGQLLAIHYGAFSRSIALVPRRRVQIYGTLVSPFQTRKKLATLRVSLASGPAAASFNIVHLPQETALGILDWLRKRR